MPPQIIIFRLGKCYDGGHNSRISIDIFLDNDSPPYRIGYLEKDVQSTCHEPGWPDDFLKRSYILHEKVEIKGYDVCTGLINTGPVEQIIMKVVVGGVN